MSTELPSDPVAWMTRPDIEFADFLTAEQKSRLMTSVPDQAGMFSVPLYAHPVGWREALACVDAARRYLQLLQQPGEELTDAIERVAELFRQETGYLRPGKDCRLHDPKIRFEAWERWVRERLEAVSSSLAAFDATQEK